MFLHASVRRIFFVFIFIGIQVYDGNASSHYTNTWAVHIPNVDQENVNEIARRHGMINMGQVGLKLCKIWVYTLKIISRIRLYTKASLCEDMLKFHTRLDRWRVTIILNTALIRDECDEKPWNTLQNCPGSLRFVDFYCLWGLNV